LISQAREFPNSEFFGIDVSGTQISEGHRTIEATGLSNITLSQGDIMAIDASLGRFDYIICHGVYSWVPEQVQARVLDVCRENLNPSGVALVSYNVYPGWHFLGVVRDMMLFHIRQYTGTKDRIGQARAVLDLIGENANPETPYGRMLATEMERIRKADDTYLFHDHLETENKPLYFHEFVERADKKGLQYLSDSNFSRMMPHNVPKQVAQALAKAPMVPMEQYLDFLRNTSFRYSLLCHRDVRLQRNIKPEILDRFQLALAEPPTDVDVNLDPATTDEGKISFKNGAFQTTAPLVKAAFLELQSSWPNALSLDELFERCQRVLRDKAVPAEIHGTRHALAVVMLQTVFSGITVAHVHPPRLCTSLDDRPMVDAFVRVQARHGPTVTNLRHETVTVSEVARQMLMELDGEHSIQELANTLKERIRRGELNVTSEGGPITSPTPELIDSLVQQGLEQIREALLLTEAVPLPTASS
ncbi:MAG: methyltransferase regulatory domain-containing protein, partial [Planctomycetota bacterium]